MLKRPVIPKPNNNNVDGSGTAVGMRDTDMIWPCTSTSVFQSYTYEEAYL